MDPTTEINNLLISHNAILKRRKKHLVYILPNGETFIRSSTPSDDRGDLNNLHELQRLLGVNGAERGAPGARRPRKRTTVAAAPKLKPRAVPVAETLMAEKLQMAGVTEGLLRDSLEVHRLNEAELRGRVKMYRLLVHEANEANRRKRLALRRMAHKCWWCKLKRLLRVRIIRRWWHWAGPVPRP